MRYLFIYLLTIITSIFFACTKDVEANDSLTVHGVTYHYSKDSVLIYKHHSFLYTYACKEEVEWFKQNPQQVLCEADGRYSISYYRFEGETCVNN